MDTNQSSNQIEKFENNQNNENEDELSVANLKYDSEQMNSSSQTSKIFLIIMSILGFLLIVKVLFQQQNSAGFQDQSTTQKCFFSCKTCQGPSKYECLTCHKDFKMSLEKTCELSEKLNKNQDIEFSLLKDGINFAIYHQKGLHSQKWVLSFEEMEESELQDYEFTEFRKMYTLFSPYVSNNPLFYNYTMSNVILKQNQTDVLRHLEGKEKPDDDGETKQQQQEEILPTQEKKIYKSLQLLAEKCQFYLVQELILVGVGERGVKMVLKQAKIVQQYVQQEFKTNAKVKVILDGDISQYLVSELANLPGKQIPIQMFPFPTFLVTPLLNFHSIERSVNRDCKNFTDENALLQGIYKEKNEQMFKQVIDSLSKQQENNKQLVQIYYVDGFSFSNITYLSYKTTQIAPFYRFLQVKLLSWLKSIDKAYEGQYPPMTQKENENEVMLNYKPKFESSFDFPNNRTCKTIFVNEETIAWSDEVALQDNFAKEEEEDNGDENNQNGNNSNHNDTTSTNATDTNAGIGEKEYKLNYTARDRMEWMKEFPKVSKEEAEKPELFNDYGKVQYSLMREDFVEPRGAKCLTGGLPQLYIKRGRYRQRIVIAFQGADEIRTGRTDTYIQDIEKRTKTMWGDTGTWGSIFAFNNGPYKDFTQLRLPYCDGSLMQGYEEEPVEINGNKYYFRGEENVSVSLYHLYKKLDLAQAKTVVVLGLSSGGMQMLFNVDLIKEVIHSINPYTKVYGISDGGLFIDFPAYYPPGQEIEEISYKERVIDKGFWQFANKNTAPPNKKCVDFYRAAGEEWKCIFPEFNLKFIETPILFVQSGYDYVMANRICQIYCLGYKNDSNFSGSGMDMNYDMRGCSQEQLRHLEKFREKQIKIINEANEGKKVPLISVWMPSCAGHIYNFGSFGVHNSVPQNSGNSLSPVIERFLNGEQLLLFDDVLYPGNKACADRVP